MPKKVYAALVATLIVLLVSAPAGAARTATSPAGAATAVNTILSIDLGSLNAKLGVDRADSSLSSRPYAAANLDVLQSDISSIPGAARDSRKGDASGATAIGAGTRTLDGVGSATVTTGKVSTLLIPDKVSSSIVFDVASADLGPGLLQVSSVLTTTATNVGTSSASVARSIDIGTISLGPVGSILDALGVDPLTLGCTGLEAAGAELGVDTDQGCEVLAQIGSDMGDTQAAFEAAQAVLESDLVSATSTIAGITLIDPSLVALAAKYGQDIAGSILNPISAGQRQALIDEIQSRLDDLNAGIAEAAGETCATVLEAIEQVSADIPDMAADLDAVETSLTTGCATLAGLLDDLLDVSLLTMDGIDISMTTLAQENTPAASAVGQIGDVKIGNTVSVGLPIELGAETAETAAQTIRDDLHSALDALGLGDFPAPTIDVLDSSVSHGKRTDGAWYAKASVTTLHVFVPSTTLEGPPTDNLTVLAPDVTSVRPARSRPGRMAPVTSPSLTVDLASFSGSSNFRPGVAPREGDPAPGPDASGSTDEQLPITGIPVAALYVGGAVLLGAAAGVRRFLVER